MKRPPTKKTVTSRVANICDKRSWVRERISRKVQIIKLSQKMTTKATRNPTTIASELARVVKNELPLEVGVLVGMAVAVAVGVTAGPILCTNSVNVIAGLTPLSVIHWFG